MGRDDPRNDFLRRATASMSKAWLYQGATCRHCLTWVPTGAMVCARCLAIKRPVAFEAKGMLVSGLVLMGIGGIAFSVAERMSGSGVILAGAVAATFAIAAVWFVWRAATLFMAWYRYGRVDFCRWAPETRR